MRYHSHKMAENVIVTVGHDSVREPGVTSAPFADRRNWLSHRRRMESKCRKQLVLVSSPPDRDDQQSGCTREANRNRGGRMFRKLKYSFGSALLQCLVFKVVTY